MFRRKKPAEQRPANKWAEVVKRLAENEEAAQKKARENQPRTKVFQPHWPLGSVGRFYVKQPAQGDALGLMAVERLPLHSVRRIDTGFVLLAGEQSEYLFEVNTDGESADCVPWDDAMEREFQLRGGDILPSFEMPDPDLEPTEATQVDEVLQPVGIITQTDSELYHSGERTEEYLVPVLDRELAEDKPENDFVKGARIASEVIRKDTEERRKREAEAAAAEAHVAAQARQGADK